MEFQTIAFWAVFLELDLAKFENYFSKSESKKNKSVVRSESVNVINYLSYTTTRWLSLITND